MMKFKKGFTLFEVLICLLITSFLLLFILPSYSQFLSQSKEEAIHTQVLREISFARSQAKLRGKTIGFCQSADHLMCGGSWEEGQIIFVDENQNGKIENNDKIIAVFDMPKNNGKLHWRSALGLEYLQILPSEFTRGEQGTFWYCRNKVKTPSWAIVINHAARARLVTSDLNYLPC